MAWKVRINIMCLLGVLLGFLCLALPALTETMAYNHLGHSGTMEYHLYMSSSRFVGVWTDPPLIPSLDYAFVVVVFFVGVALAAITPLGGVSMAIGIFGYYLLLNSRFDTMRSTFAGPGRIVTSIDWGAAFYIGTLATVVTLLSFVFPAGPGYSVMYSPWPLRRGHLKERLLVWGKGKKL
jgi:hypothetical protein